ncbi:energy-coupling factor transporter ATPase [Kroppenstedtia pulmonis]|uniref:Energy-coupling factor transporter ATPase n=1 Tax=Kroppenstedtia pulmonis TaxID=1380685 RepID=A0A7D3XPE4_9BACL|nr:energy-coupling factor transporter ATPase [Kroppenstedtia pulmonis]QKG85569.1 energy-coupling factor transporter ATPase [Kroppenstedtia pulmonis]
MKPLIELEEVGFHYSPEPIQGEWALNGVDLQVHPGEYLAIMGPNGSGKSTLAKMLNGLLIPSKGHVKVGGMDTQSEEIWEIRRMVGMVFQNPDNQIVGTTVRDDVAFGMENMGIPRDDMLQRIKEVLDQVGLSSMEETSPHHLSGGQKQRLAIASVMAMKPQAVVFDEATSMLDPSGRHEVIQAIRDLKEQGTAVIHITHSAEEAMQADRLIVMAQGTILLEGVPEQVFQQSDVLRRWSLELPFHIELSDRLLRRGLPLPGVASNSDRLVEDLWVLLSKD